MKQSKSKKLYKKEADRRNKSDAKDMGKFEMRPKNPYKILNLKKDKPDEHK